MVKKLKSRDCSATLRCGQWNNYNAFIYKLSCFKQIIVNWNRERDKKEIWKNSSFLTYISSENKIRKSKWNWKTNYEKWNHQKSYCNY